MSVKGIEAISEMAEGYGSSRFIRLEHDGDAVTGAFLGEPLAYEVVWVEGKTEEYDKTDDRHSGLEVRMVVAWNFFDREKGEMRVWERGITFFRQWKRQSDRHGLRHWFTIERSGKAGSKKTTYLLEREDEIADAKWSELESLPLNELGKDAAPTAADANVDAAKYEESPQVLTTAIANDLKQRLKEMPVEAIDKFLAHFAVTRIKDVPREKEQSAIRFVDMLAHPSKSDSPKTREIDPFA